MIRESRLLEQIEELGMVDKNLSGAAKHSRLKDVANAYSIGVMPWTNRVILKKDSIC